MSGNSPENLLLPKSKYSSFEQFLRSGVIFPVRELYPRASFWREGREQISARGSSPESLCFERSIPAMEPAELQETPVKEQMGFDGAHEEKSVGLEDWREDLRERREVSSEPEMVEEREKQRRRMRKRMREKEGGMMGGGGKREREREVVGSVVSSIGRAHV